MTATNQHSKVEVIQPEVPQAVSVYCFVLGSAVHPQEGKFTAQTEGFNNFLGKGFEEKTTGEPLKAMNTLELSSGGNKQGQLRRRLIWVFRVRDNSTCRICGSPGHNVHHILPKRFYPHWKKETTNMISLCFDCHNKADKEVYSVDYLFSLIP